MDGRYSFLDENRLYWDEQLETSGDISRTEDFVYGVTLGLSGIVGVILAKIFLKTVSPYFSFSRIRHKNPMYYYRCPSFKEVGLIWFAFSNKNCEHYRAFFKFLYEKVTYVMTFMSGMLLVLGIDLKTVILLVMNAFSK